MRTFAKVTARDGLLLHRSSSPESERLELMPLGSRVEILDEKHPMSYVEWHSPTLGQIRGYAHEHWLKVDAINPPRIDPEGLWSWRGLIAGGTLLTLALALAIYFSR